MKLCSACMNRFRWEAIGWHRGKELFCSMECLPEGMMDEPYALQYVGLIESYSLIEKHPTITSHSNQQELLDEIEYFITQTEEYVLGDDEGYFYKVALADLHNKMLMIQKKVQQHFTKKEHFHFDIGLFIGWDNIRMGASIELALELQLFLQQRLNENKDQPTIMYNHELNAITEWQNILYFDDDDGIHPIIEMLYETGLAFFEPLLEEDLDISDLISYIELARCPKCELMEPWEDFSFKVDDQIITCSSCFFIKKGSE